MRTPPSSLLVDTPKTVVPGRRELVRKRKPTDFYSAQGISLINLSNVYVCVILLQRLFLFDNG